MVEWKGQRLSVFADGTPLIQVLAEVARRTGLEVRAVDGLRQTVYSHFAGSPLREGLIRLLANVNYALVEVAPSPRGGGHLVVVVIGGSASLPAQPPPPAKDQTLTTPPPAPDTPEDVAARLHDAAKHGNLAPLRRAATSGDRIAQAVALQLLAQHSPLDADSLAAAAARSSDLNRRLNALQVLADIDSSVAVNALGAALDDPNAVVRQSAVMGLLGQTGPHAVGFLTQATCDRDASIRILALDFLAQRGPEGAAGLAFALKSADPQVSARARELLDQMSAAQ